MCYIHSDHHNKRWEELRGNISNNIIRDRDSNAMEDSEAHVVNGIMVCKVSAEDKDYVLQYLEKKKDNTSKGLT